MEFPVRRFLIGYSHSVKQMGYIPKKSSLEDILIIICCAYQNHDVKDILSIVYLMMDEYLIAYR